LSGPNNNALSILAVQKQASPYLFALTMVLPVRPPDVMIFGFQMEESKGNVKVIEMKAPEADLYKAENLVRVKSPETLLHKNNNKSFLLKANEAIANLESHDVFFKGPTDLFSPEGFVVQGRNLSYSHKNQNISSEENIQFESTPEIKNSFIQGWAQGLDADLASKIFFFKKDVSLNVLPLQKGASPSQIKGQEAKVFSDKGMAHIQGDVAFKNQNLTLRADSLELEFESPSKSNKKSAHQAVFKRVGSSKVVSHFDTYKLLSHEVILALENQKEISLIKAQGDIVLINDQGLQMTSETLEISNPMNDKRRMKLLGKVKITQNQDIAYCDEAIFDPKNDNLFLKGNASFKRGEDTIVGEEISYSKKTSLIQVKGATGQLQRSRVLPKRESP
jgi:lipopolysaccharide export system protein LptA